MKLPGVTPAQAILSVTMIKAEASRWRYQIGSDKGKFAALVAVSGDLLAEITELQRVRSVVKGIIIVVCEHDARKSGAAWKLLNRIRFDNRT